MQMRLTSGLPQVGQTEVISTSNHFSSSVNWLDRLLKPPQHFATHLVLRLHCGVIKISFLYCVHGPGRRNSISPPAASRGRCAPPLISIMGYYLQAFVGKKNDLIVIQQFYSKSKLIELAQDICIIPMTEDLFDQINNFIVSENINQSEYLTINIEKEILSKIAERTIAYIEAEFFGGEGGQNGVIWKEHQRHLVIPFEQDAINKVLQFFGVTKKTGLDEFDTLGLGRNRKTSDWINDKS